MFQVTISENLLQRVRGWFLRRRPETWVMIISTLAAVGATWYYYSHGLIVAYGDSESHLNIAKRVVDSLTPGFAQLGGIWLPLPHLLLMPFVYSDFLWRSGLAGSIVSGISFIVSAVFLYKQVFLLTQNKLAGFVASLVFISNPNILYLQSTPMTELNLIVFFILSTYYFTVFLENEKKTLALLAAAFFGFCATLSRYDGWFLVAIEALVLAMLYAPWKKIPRSIKNIKEHWDHSRFGKMQGYVVLFSTLAFFGIFLWLLWDWLILGDPLYFTNSVFSAKSQQQAWLARGELPSYHNVFYSFFYYFVTSMSNVGVVLFATALAGLYYYTFRNRDRKRWFIILILLVPFIFNVITLFLGQSVIFIPHITSNIFEWRMFNVRYGVMMVPFAAVCIAYLFYKVRPSAKLLIATLAVLQLGLYVVGYSKVISLSDGIEGLSSATGKNMDAQYWLTDNYDGGLVLADDFARSVSIIRSGIPMRNMIYIGNKPYWEDSLKEPEKYATWIVMQQNDDLWKNILEKPDIEGRMYKYFNKVYTSPEVLIFKRNPDVPKE